MKCYVAMRCTFHHDDPEGPILAGSDRGEVVAAAKRKLGGTPSGTNCESFAWREQRDYYELAGVVMTNGKTMPIKDGTAFFVEGLEWIG